MIRSGLIASFMVVAVACVAPRAQSQGQTSTGAAACPVPYAAPQEWREAMSVAAPAVFRIPAEYTRQQLPVQIDDAKIDVFGSGDFQRLTIQEITASVPLDSGVVQRDKRFTDYSACREVIHGRAAIVQAFRGSGTVFSGRGRSPTYDVHLTLQIAPNRYLQVAGVSDSRTGQEELLAIVRTFRVTVP